MPVAFTTDGGDPQPGFETQLLPSAVAMSASLAISCAHLDEGSAGMPVQQPWSAAIEASAVDIRRQGANAHCVADLFHVKSPHGTLMPRGPDHAACVDTWLERSSSNLSAERRLQLFEKALGALWACTRTTLGEVTLAAIVGRVLHNAGERFPIFSSLSVDPDGGVHGPELPERARVANDPELEEGIRFVLVEFLSVLGNLTAEILTPELHAELLQVDLRERREGEGPT
jgi:hypothetical protein